MPQSARTNKQRKQGEHLELPIRGKRPRNLSLSNGAWEGLTEKAKARDISVSELAERIGLNLLTIEASNENPELFEILIYQRLKSFVKHPVAVFWSLIYFTKRTTKQLGLDSDDDSCCQIIFQAMTIVFYIGYMYPDQVINNPSAFLKWLCYRIIEPKSLHDDHVILRKEDRSTEVNDCISKIKNAVEKLKNGSNSPQLRVLKMRVIDGLTLDQIHRMLRLQASSGIEVSDIRNWIKDGLSTFRKLWEDDINTKYFSKNSVVDCAQEETLEQAKAYCSLVLLEKFSRKNIQDMGELLIGTKNNPYLDFWFNEIDHFYGCKSFPITEVHYVRDKIENEMSEYILKKKKKLDTQFAFCQTQADILGLLDDKCCEESERPNLLIDLIDFERSIF
jgi:hypothetical protein